MPNLIGQSLGRYHILEQLGEGGMATVYKAYDTRLERDVAVKVIRVDQFGSSMLERILKRLDREAKALARLTHPNIVSVIDYGEYEGAPYLIMSYLPGGTLKQKLGKPMPWQEAVRTLLPIAEALDYAHSQKIVHRDVKPSNILLTNRGQPMLTDFGIAKILESEDAQTLTGTGVGVGTPEYMAPEQVNARDVDGRADIYSLGIVLYELITGRKPFQADTPMAVMIMQSRDPLPRPTQYVPDLPEAVEKVLLKALAKKPEDRYEDMDGFSRAMEGLLSGTPPVAQAAAVSIAAPQVARQPTEPDTQATMDQMETPVPVPVTSKPEGATRTLIPPIKTTAAAKPSILKRQGWKMILIGAVVLVGAAGVFWAGMQLSNGFPSLSKPSAPPTRVPTESTNGQPQAYLPDLKAGCTDAIGCVEVKSGAPIHFAYAMVIAGPDATLGIDSRNGAEIAIDERGGKLLGHDILFDGENDGCSAEGGQAAGTKLAADPSIVAILGTSCSSALRAAMPLWSDAGFTVVSASNTASDLTLVGNENNHPGYLRTSHSDKVQGAAAAHFVYEVLGLRKAATIHDGSIYADSLQQVFVDTFKKLGGTITAQESVRSDQVDMSGVLTSIAAGSPEFIYHPIFIAAGTQLILQARTTPGLENVIQMGADGMFSPDVMEGAGPAVEGVYVSSPDFTQFGADYTTKFLPAYEAKFGSAPVSIFHAHAYDALNMVASCIEKVAIGDKEGGDIFIGRQALRDCMYSTKDFKGLTGNLTCTPTGDCADPKIAVYQYHTGEYPPTKVWP